MKKNSEQRSRNPFRDPLVTELLEDPVLYRKMFSESILVGETRQVFQPANVVLVGPQGSGKSMILNLILYPVISAWIAKNGKPPVPLKHLAPFFGISINLVTSNFHAFGRRSVTRAINSPIVDEAREPASAADFLNHFLFHRFLEGIGFLLSDEGGRLREWMGIEKAKLEDENLFRRMGAWDVWFGYYSDCATLEDLLKKCSVRLSIWRSFLNTNIDELPKDVWQTKSEVGRPLHEMGRLLDSLGPKDVRLPLFVVIDQYEVLPELNPSHGTTLQRVVNTLIKARDPFVFYKIGARTYDWGTELRIWGAESRVEVQRDYVTINLSDVLMKNEDGRFLFRNFAREVAYKRLRVEGNRVPKDEIEKMLGPWFANREASFYIKNRSRLPVLLPKTSDALRNHIAHLCGIDGSPVDLRLAAAWALQKKQRGVAEEKIINALREYPWRSTWWKKERVEIALLQIASLANQKRRYFGWDNVLYLSGANISAFLLLCSEIWDNATKLGINPPKHHPLDPIVQSGGILVASEKWRIRDRIENIGGRKRYAVLSRLGPAIHDTLIGDLAISNPGHSGFSLREADLAIDKPKNIQVAEFLERAVSWAILEERSHTSKAREGATRRKWYLHPLLSPEFDIPHKRVKEPLYVEIDDVFEWLFGTKRIAFGRSAGLQRNRSGAKEESRQLRMFEG
jgi:hypothetical protein